MGNIMPHVLVKEWFKKRVGVESAERQPMEY